MTEIDKAPARFSEEAKAEWPSLDPEVRSETIRMIRELTAGHEKHRPGAERDAQMAEFHDLAAERGMTLKQMIGGFVEVESAWRRDHIQGIIKTCEMMGIDPIALFKHVLSQPAEAA